jgi:hypothetical protein
MASKMGTHGPDLLYDLMVASSAAVRERAKALLGAEAVRELATPALRIAYDLRVAPTCMDLVKLLPAAGKEGDERSVAVMSYTINGAKTGCGQNRRARCPAKCAGEYLPPIRAAMKQIETRAGG